MDPKTYFVLVDKLGHYAHRYQDLSSKVVKTTRHFCDAKHIYTDKPYVYEGFRAIKVTSTFEDYNVVA